MWSIQDGGTYLVSFIFTAMPVILKNSLIYNFHSADIQFSMESFLVMGRTKYSEKQICEDGAAWKRDSP